MITVRLEPELERLIEITAKQFGITKSEVIRRSLREYLKKMRAETTPWELGKDLFGKYSSGKRNLSKDRKKILRLKLLEKHFEKTID